MPAHAAAIASRALGLGPRGFSFDASLTIVSSAKPYSRASSSIGFPGTYGAIRRTYSGASAAGPTTGSPAFIVRLQRDSRAGASRERDRVRAQQLEKRRARPEFAQRRGNRGLFLVAFEIDEKQILPQPGARR